MAVDVQGSGLRIVASDDGTILDLAPLQGIWTERQYLRMTDHSRRLLEFTDGVLEVLPMPTQMHQVISRFLLFAFFGFIHQRGGTVLYAPLRLQTRPGKFREPGLLLVQDAADPRCRNDYWRGADLVVEIVSPNDQDRDTTDKVADYAEAGIPEYWIVNPENETITVLRLEHERYTEHGLFRRDETASSALLADFAVSVNDVFDAR